MLYKLGFSTIKYALVVILLAMCSLSTVVAQQSASAPSGNLSRNQVDLLVGRLAGKPFDSFVDFVVEVYQVGQPFLSTAQKNAMAKFVAHHSLVGRDREVMFRVLGVYAQLKYGGESLSLLSEFVALDSKATDATRVHLEKRAEQYGLRFRVIDDGFAEIRFSKRVAAKRQQGGKRLVFYVPLTEDSNTQDSWVLPDGSEASAAKLTKANDKLYGRGLRAGKAALAAALTSMRVLQEEKTSLHNDIRLLVDLNPSNARASLDRYLSTFPEVNFLVNLSDDYALKDVSGAGQAGSAHWATTLLALSDETFGARSQRVPSLKHHPKLVNGAEFLFSLSEPKQTENADFSAGATGDRAESKPLEEFLLSLQMLSEIMVRLGQDTRLSASG